MAIISTYKELREWGQEEKAQGMLKEARQFSVRNDPTTFLSHSSKDDDLVSGVVLILRNHGATVYVDHADPTIQGADCVAIAAKLRGTISKCKKFVMLATPRSKDSKWIPWELGLGDGLRKEINVAIFPAAESSYETEWSEQEYLGLYARVAWGRLEGREKPLWLVWNHRNNTASSLSDWLKA